MITSERHRPAWRRWSPHVLRVVNLRDHVAAERERYPAGSPATKALGRALRALETALSEMSRPD